MKTKERQCLHFRESTIWAWLVSRRWNEECHVCCPVHHIYREACDRLGERRQVEVRTYPNVKVSSNRMYSTMWPEIGASAYTEVDRLLQTRVSVLPNCVQHSSPSSETERRGSELFRRQWTYDGIFADHHIEGFIEPAIVCFTMQCRASIRI